MEGGLEVEDTRDSTLPPLPVSVHLSSLIKVGGSLVTFFHIWRTITSNAWVLQTVQGFHIEFYSFLHQVTRPRSLLFSQQEAELVDAEVASLLKIGAIYPTGTHPHGFISNIFLVDKTSGRQRPVINLRKLNEWLVYCHFKMESIHLLQDVLCLADWMVCLDLKYAYLAIPIFLPHRKFLSSFAYVSVCNPTIRSLLRPLVLHEGAQTGSGTPPGTGDLPHYFAQRHAPPGTGPPQLSAHLKAAVNLLESLGFVLNKKKFFLISRSKSSVSGFCYRFH